MWHVVVKVYCGILSILGRINVPFSQKYDIANLLYKRVTVPLPKR